MQSSIIRSVAWNSSKGRDAGRTCLFCSTTLPKQRLKKKLVFFKGANKKWRYLPRGARGICLSFLSISLPWPGGCFLWKTMVLSTASVLRATGLTDVEAALNVREWIREADYALEVRTKQSEIKRKLEWAEWAEWMCLNVSVHAFLADMCAIQMHVFVGLCVYLCLGIWIFK